MKTGFARIQAAARTATALALITVLAGCARTGAPVEESAETRAEPGPASLLGGQVRSKCMRGPCPAGMCFIPGGEFTAGCTYPECRDYAPVVDMPPHTVNVAPFCMDRTEVSNAEFERFMPERRENRGRISTGDDHPVVQAPLDQAIAYCAWRGGFLPLERQWELAARGFEGHRFPWGPQTENPPANILGDDDGYALVAPVTAFPEGQSPFGILNMAGNVMEWTLDCPPGRSHDCQPVLKGGGWLNQLEETRTTYRLGVSPTIRSNQVGFRCAALPKPRP